MSTTKLRYPTIAELLDQLKLLRDGLNDETVSKLRFVFIGDNKAPIGQEWNLNPYTIDEAIAQLEQGGTLWKVKSKDSKTEELYHPSIKRRVKAIGLLCGDLGGGLVGVDHDGHSCDDKIRELQGVSPDEALPHTLRVTSGRDGRYTSFYFIPDEFRGAVKSRVLKTGVKDKEDDKKEEQLDFRYQSPEKGGLQCVIIGHHPITGRYKWWDGCSPNDVGIATAPTWVVEQMLTEPAKDAPQARQRIDIAHHADHPDKTTREWALDYLRYIPNHDLDWYEWRDVILALNKCGVSESEAIAWSATSSKHTDKGFDEVWRYIDNKGTCLDIGTLGYLAKKNGWKYPAWAEDRKPKKSQSAKTKDLGQFQEIDPSAIKMGVEVPELCKTISLKLLIEGAVGNDLRLNLLSSDVEFRGNPINQGRYKTFLAELINKDVSREDAIELIGLIAEKNAYDPVCEWLEELNQKYGDSTIHLLDSPSTRYLGTTGYLYDLYLRHFFISSVARRYEPGCKVDDVVILQGKQGTRKSTTWRVLAGDDWFDDSLGDDLESKDEVMKIHKAWINEIAEFERVTTKREASILKNFCSRQVDSFRAPYDRAVARHPRRCVLVGSVNPDEFLIDGTGNRRFRVIPIKEVIDIDSIKADRDKLWAAAVALYKRGEQWTLTPELEALAAQQVSAFEATDLWFDAVAGWLISPENTHRKDGKEYAVPSQILKDALGIEIGKQDQKEKRRISAILKQLGWEPCPNVVKLHAFGNRPIRAWVKVTVDETVTNTVTNTVTTSNPHIEPVSYSGNSSNGIYIENYRVTDDVGVTGSRNGHSPQTSNLSPGFIGENNRYHCYQEEKQPTEPVSAVTEEVTVDSANRYRYHPKVGDRVRYVGEHPNYSRFYAAHILTVDKLKDGKAICSMPDGSKTTNLPIQDLRSIEQ